MVSEERTSDMSSSTPDTAPSRLRIALIEQIVIVAATATIIAAVLQAAPLQSANDRSRWATVWSLVERKTFQIDEIDSIGRWSTIDKVRYRTSDDQPWHFYSSKPPLLSTIVAGLYAVERATLGRGLFNDTAFVTRLLLMFVNVVPFYFTLRSLSHCLQILGSSLTVRIFILAVAGFGSILNPYLTTLNNHTPAVACAMFAITAAARIFSSRISATASSEQADEKENSTSAEERCSANFSLTVRRRDFAALGFFSALTCCFELPAAQMGLLAFVAALIASRRWALAWFIPAALVPLVAFFVTNWLATGGVKPFYATYGTDTYVYVHNGIPSYWSNPRDLDASTESTPVYLFHCVLGHHGLLSLTPVLCVSLIGWWFSLSRTQNTVRRMLILVGAMMSLITLGFYLSRTQNYNYGGNSVGLRWMMWLTPFWWLAMLPAMEKITRPRFQTVVALLLLVSIASVSWSLNRPWRPSWLYEQMEAAGWIEYRTAPKPFEPRRFSVLGTLPTVPNTEGIWVNGEGRRLILTTDVTQNGFTGIKLQMIPGDVYETVRHGQQDRSGLATLDMIASRRRFETGMPWLTLRDAVKTPVQSAIDERQVTQMLQGLPQIRAFNSAGSTWVPSKSDPSKAWQVERAAARISADDPFFGKCWYRCDVKFCDALPFGVLQWTITITSDQTGEVLSTQTWIAENY